MGTFFDTPTFGTNTAFALPGVVVQTKTYSTGDTGSESGAAREAPLDNPLSFDDMPYPSAVIGQYSSYNAAGKVAVTNFSSFTDAVTASESALSDAQSALDAARDELATAQDAVDAAQSAFDVEQSTLESLEKTAYVAFLALLAAQAGTDADLTASKTDANTTAVRAVVAQRAVVVAKQALLATAISALAPKQSAVDDAISAVGYDAGLVTQAQFNLAVAQAGLLGTSSPSDPSTIGAPFYNPYALGAVPYTLTTGAVALHSTNDDDPGGSYQSTSGRYRLTFTLSDDQHQVLLAQSGYIRVDWSEVTHTIGAVVDGIRQADTIDSAELKNETLSAGSATQDETTGNWLFATSDYDVADPGGNQYIVVAGPARMKNYTSIDSGELRGAEASRQGWREFTTDPGAAYGRRYLTMTLSAAANAPAGNNYTGTYSLLDPDFTTVTDPAIIGAIDEQALQDDENPVALNSRVIDPVTRVLNTPAGLQLTLSDEETPASIQATVAAACAFDDPAITGTILSVPGAINDCPASGDYAAKQTMRYKVSYTSASQRGRDTSAYSDYFEITKRTTDLRTGIATVEQVPFTITFAYTPATGVPGAGFTDTDYTVIDVPGPMTLVEVFQSASESIDPSTPYGAPTLSFAAGAPTS